jgi:1,4-dihydroxy-2-naphthoate octaprenyltransferase
MNAPGPAANALTSLPWQTWVHMTRPGFLIITAVACVLGLATARVSGVELQVLKALVTVVLAVLLHAAANVLNDYHDALNGADEANNQGLFPFTGGARLIQNGLVSVQQTRQLALALLWFLVPCGVMLAVVSGVGLFALGLAGVFLAWAYSAPPLALMKHGLGELAVALTWALMVIGADYVQRGQFFIIPVAVSLSYGLLIGNILLINGFPDAQADAQVGKRSLVVNLGPRLAALVYLFWTLLAHAWVVWGVRLFIHPETAWWGLASFPISLWAAVLLWQNATQPQYLKPAIVLTIVVAVVHGLAMAAGFLFLYRL